MKQTILLPSHFLKELYDEEALPSPVPILSFPNRIYTSVRYGETILVEFGGDELQNTRQRVVITINIFHRDLELDTGCIYDGYV